MSTKSNWRMLCVAGEFAVALSVVILLGTLGAFCQTPDSEPRTTAERTPRLSTTVSAPMRTGGTQKLLIEIDDWRFSQGDTQMTMPASGTGVLAVGNGTISVRIAGASKTYNTGDYWNVPAGTQMTVSVQAPIRGAVVRTIIAIPAV